MVVALLLAAGFGNRLGPLTSKTPKCLIEVNQQPMLDHWLTKLEPLGVEKFFINTHYLSEKVKQYCRKHPLSDKIELTHEPTLLGTAGTINNNIDRLAGNKAFIVHVDNYCDDDLTELASSFADRPSDSLLTMLTFRTKDPKNCGIVELDENQMLVNFHEKVPKPPSNLASGAIFIASPSFFRFFNKHFKNASDFSTDVIPNLLNKVNCYETNRFFIDIGTPIGLRMARDFAKGTFSHRQRVRI